ALLAEITGVIAQWHGNLRLASRSYPRAKGVVLNFRIDRTNNPPIGVIGRAIGALRFRRPPNAEPGPHGRLWLYIELRDVPGAIHRLATLVAARNISIERLSPMESTPSGGWFDVTLRVPLAMARPDGFGVKMLQEDLRRLEDASGRSIALRYQIGQELSETS